MAQDFSPRAFDNWRLAAEYARLAAAEHMQKAGDAPEIQAAATEADFRDWYDTTVLPTEMAARDQALTALIAHGTPLRYHRPYSTDVYRSPLSTGMRLLEIEEAPAYVGSLLLGVALRLNVEEAGEANYSAITKAVKACRKDDKPERVVAARAELDGLIKAIQVDAWHVTSDPNLMRSLVNGMELAEAVYPTTRYERKRDDQKYKTREYINALLRDHPDVRVWTNPFYVFGPVHNSFRLGKPGALSPASLGLEEATKRALGIGRNSQTLLEMLPAMGVALKDLPSA
jgi:hypothetical protein